MRILLFCLLVEFLFIACSEENPTDFSVYNSTANESSSSVQKIGSSSSNISSSSNDVYSSNSESSSSNLISSSSTIPVSYGELIDERDGQIYKTVKIGEQTWMAENLNFDYHNPFAPTPALAAPSYCYDNSQDNCKRYGRLYRWSIAMDSAAVYSNSGKGCGIWSNQNESPCKNELYSFSRGTCPENWHIPTESEVKNFVNYANASPENVQWVAHYWFYGSENDAFAQKNIDSIFYYFLTSIEIDSSKATLLFTSNNDFRTVDGLKSDAFFVRCVKDTLPILNIKQGEIVDERDGQTYKTVKIGEQTWMAENLNYAYLKPSEDQDSSSWCYNNEPDSCAKYGRLYTWDAAFDCKAYESTDECYQNNYNKYRNNTTSRGICPENWHIPSYNEWSYLLEFANLNANTIKSTYGWNDNGNGTDIFSFGILPAGNYIPDEKIWLDIGESTCFWTTFQITVSLSFDSRVYPTSDALAICFSDQSSLASKIIDYLMYETPKSEAYSVRCVKDE